MCLSYDALDSSRLKSVRVMSACTISLPRRTDAGYCYRDDAGLNVCLLSVSVSVTTVIPLKRFKTPLGCGFVSVQRTIRWRLPHFIPSHACCKGYDTLPLPFCTIVVIRCRLLIEADVGLRGVRERTMSVARCWKACR